jgi:hypothetical protein
MRFVWVLEQTVIMTPHNINLLVFVTEMELFTARYKPNI